MKSTRLLILSPHPDDEVLGCTALIAETLRGGGSVRVVVVTDGAAGGDAWERKAELARGLAVLGVPTVTEWGYPDGALPLSGGIGERYRDLVAGWQPTVLALPAPEEAHADHRRLTRGALEALTGSWVGDLIFYETTSLIARPNQTLALDLDLKCRALACHASQQAQYDYLGHATGLARLRGAAIGISAAEAYLHFPWDGSPQNFFEHRPLVSVIVRSDDAELLAIAMRSLEDQTYDQLEVIVVWHGEGDLPVLSPMLTGVVVRGPGPRAANLNAGVSRARGAMIGFLDQDDIWTPNHLASLVTELNADPTLDLAYGDYVLAACRRGAAEVAIVEQREVATNDHVPGRLLVGNHIPLNAMLCRGGLVRGLRFDETLGAYEDWEFLARAELSGARMRRVSEVVCQYRVFPEAGESADLDVLHRRKGYLAWRPEVVRRILAKMAPESLENLLLFANALETERNEWRDRALRAERRSEELRVGAEYHRASVLSVDEWADLLCADQPSSDPVSRLAGKAFADGPVIAVVVPVCDPPPELFGELLNSIYRQTYPRWQLCLADDGSGRPDVHEMLQRISRLSEHDPRIRLIRRSERGGIVAASNSAIGLSDASWLAFVDHDDRLHPDALLEVAAAIRRAPDLHAIYTDSRMVDRNGVLLHTYRKPAWSPETLLHLNYINHLSVVRRDVHDRIGGLRTGYDGSQDWDYWLRLRAVPEIKVHHIGKPLYDWRSTETSVAYSMNTKPYALDAACRATQDALERLGIQGATSSVSIASTGLRHEWSPTFEPLTAIVLTHRNPSGLGRLIDILRESAYPDLNVCVVANRVDPADHESLSVLESIRGWPNGSVIEDDRAFNWAALNNAAAARGTSPWLLFLNDDVEWDRADTLQRLTRYLTLDPMIGAVGMHLAYGDEEGGGIQHDGIRLDSRLVAHNARNPAEDGHGLGVPRNVSAVTGACLLTRREAFDRCGGFDERFPSAYNDVDYCLHLRKLGYRIVQASDVPGIHHESRTRGREWTQQDRAASELMRAKWGEFLTEEYAWYYDLRAVGTRIVNIPAAEHD